MVYKDKQTLKKRILTSIEKDLSILGLDSKEANPREIYQKMKLHEWTAGKEFYMNMWLETIHSNLATGNEALQSSIIPEVSVCQSSYELELFYVIRHYWSCPYSKGMGKTIKLFVRDAGLPKKPIIGIIELCSPVWNIGVRDEKIGWTQEHKLKRLNTTLDIHTLGSLPPYNDLLGGKLLVYLLVSREIRDLYSQKYPNQNLSCLFVSSLFGKSSLYNRIKFHNHEVCQYLGLSLGEGILQFSSRTKKLLKTYAEDILNLKEPGHSIQKYRLVLRDIGKENLLYHGMKKAIYCIPLAYNTKEYLTCQTDDLHPFQWTKNELVNYWKTRWLDQRKKNPEVLKRVSSWVPELFTFNTYTPPGTPPSESEEKQ